jgi:cytochrome c-type biogenesis protein CcmH
MLFFGLISALISACVFAGLLSLYRRSLSTSSVDKEKGLYQRFADELALRERRGEISPDLAREERTEAARALLRSNGPLAEALPVTTIEPKLLLGLGMIIALGSMGLYLIVGKPGAADQPHAARLKQWELLAEKAPEKLSAAEIAAVMRSHQAEHARDPRYWGYMAEYDLKAQNVFEAVRDLETLTRLQPNSANAWTQLGMAEVFAAEGKSTPRAKAAFEKALTLEPGHVGARYFLARFAIEAADFGAARTLTGGLMRDLDPRDERREAVAEMIGQMREAEAQDKAVKAQIRGMVGNLAATLAINPENPDGWARLLRSYTVLGDKGGLAEVEARMLEIYKTRPDQVAEIRRKAQKPVGAQ